MNTLQLGDTDLRLLRVLDALLETSSVSRAALALNVTPSAISHSLRELRSRLHDPLLVRVGGRMQPTPRAEAVRHELRRSLGALARLVAEDPKFDPASSRRSFSIAAADYPFFVGFPELVGRLRNSSPSIDLRMRGLDDRIASDLENGDLDLVLAGAEVEGTLGLAGGMMRARVIEEPFRCVVRRDNPALGAQDGVLDLGTYLDLPHVLVSTAGGDSGVVDEVIDRMGLKRRVAVTVPSFPAAIWFVLQSDLVATVPERIALRADVHAELIELAPPIELPPSTAYLWWHPRFQHDPGRIWWRRTLIDALRALPDRISSPPP